MSHLTVDPNPDGSLDETYTGADPSATKDWCTMPDVLPTVVSRTLILTFKSVAKIERFGDDNQKLAVEVEQCADAARELREVAAELDRIAADKR